eukprot:Seg8913.2 transcript_id=Seg8913.2/GoldUCD/mRNA.D3Y31 product="hypothetical protein" protein_id=Seg8913.2/GoldUCD/D3Y31
MDKITLALVKNQATRISSEENENKFSKFLKNEPDETALEKAREKERQRLEKAQAKRNAEREKLRDKYRTKYDLGGKSKNNDLGSVGSDVDPKKEEKGCCWII